MFGSVQSQDMVLPQNEVYLLSQNEMFGSVQSQNMVLPQNEVYRIFVLPQSEMFGPVQSQNMVLPQNEVYNFFVLPQNGVFNVVLVSCQLANKVKVIINSVLNLEVNLTLTLIHGGEKLGWTIRLLLESLQHVLKMYTWSMFEN
jgi:hypothetical protein